jgi:hypothetical protein
MLFPKISGDKILRAQLFLNYQKGFWSKWSFPSWTVRPRVLCNRAEVLPLLARHHCNKWIAEHHLWVLPLTLYLSFNRKILLLKTKLIPYMYPILTHNWGQKRHLSIQIHNNISPQIRGMRTDKFKSHHLTDSRLLSSNKVHLIHPS